MLSSRVESENNHELISKWFSEEVANGENSALVYPNLQSFRQIYTRYVKDEFVNHEDNSNNKNGNEEKNKINNANEQSTKPRRRIILIAPFYETVESVKHHLSAVGVTTFRASRTRVP
jgi:hypothetical protein